MFIRQLDRGQYEYAQAHKLLMNPIYYDATTDKVTAKNLKFSPGVPAVTYPQLMLCLYITAPAMHTLCAFCFYYTKSQNLAASCDSADSMGGSAGLLLGPLLTAAHGNDKRRFFQRPAEANCVN